MHHKRKRAPNRRAGCGMCKPHKKSGVTKRIKIRGLRVPRRLERLSDGQI